jgi:hypothetical protein
MHWLHINSGTGKNGNKNDCIFHSRISIINKDAFTPFYEGVHRKVKIGNEGY